MEGRKPAPTPAERLGRDELNLCQFPLGLLSDRAPKEATTQLRYQDGEKVWVVSGHPEHGLPTPADVATYVCLMELAREQQFPGRVRFTRGDLLRRLGWGDDARRYARLLLALLRWVSVTIEATECFYDARLKRRERHRAFHLLEAFDMPAKGSRETECWVRFSEEIRTNLEVGYLKRLDVGLFLSLRSSVAQALYRYLDARRAGDGKPVFRQETRTLGCEHLGLSRSYNDGQLKRELARGHAELLECGYLRSVDYRPMKGGGEMVVYRFPTGTVKPGLPVAAPPADPEEKQVVQAALAGLWNEMSAADRAGVQRLRAARAKRERR